MHTWTIQWMHNGNIANFENIKRRLQQDLPDFAFNKVLGNTGMLPLCVCTDVPHIRQILNGLSHFFCPKYVHYAFGRLLVLANQSSQIPDHNARSFSLATLQKAMAATIASLNQYAEEFGITEVNPFLIHFEAPCLLTEIQPSLMNFCVTDGESVIATRYISSKKDEAASLVSLNTEPFLRQVLTNTGVVVFFRNGVF